MDVLDELMVEHRDVEKMLEELADSEPGTEREVTLGELAEALNLHMFVEERFVYPIVKDAVGDEEEEEAENEHQLARDGLAKMRELVSQPGFAAAVDMVKAGVKHHVEDEEEEIFPELRKNASERVDALGVLYNLQEQVSDVDEEPTKAQLYDEAKEAGIPGRSQMTKSELEAALEK